jgi:hypothetical protein
VKKTILYTYICFSHCTLLIAQNNILLGSHYTQFYKNLAKRLCLQTGILIIGYNRPHYLAQVIAALEQTPEAKKLPFIFIFDGGPQARQEENCALVTKAAIKKKFIVCRDIGYGCGRSIIDARRFMFEWCGFERIVVIEDDFIVSPYYITLLLRLHTWATKRYDNVGVVQCFNICLMSRAQKEQHLYEVEESFGNFWGYCLDYTVYVAIKSLIEEHERKHLINIPETQPNRTHIAKWILRYIRQKPFREPIYPFPSALTYEILFTDIAEHLKKTNKYKRRNGQDYEMRLALYKNGFIKITTTVNRGLYIGQEGTHHTVAYWQRVGYGDMELDQFISDATNSDFVPVLPAQPRGYSVWYDL